MKAAFMLAFSFLKAGGGSKASNARKSLVSAVFGIGLSLIPLVVVLVVSDGMIQGISSRLSELSSYHLL
ncbi:MAG: ABC transporter permease, partial [Spirochaetaceae bacterium]|nr:ABC transporter permease [Spirochaetaceae bacterium]